MSKKITTEEFIEHAKNIYGDRFDYRKTQYKDAKTKVCIICKEHGEFYTLPHTHLISKSLTGACTKCSYEYRSKIQLHTQAQVIEKFKSVHGDLYDYSKTKYKNDRTKVEIICREHGSFFVTPNAHFLRKRGCKFCKKSHGENKTKLILERNNIEYVSEKIFDDCRNKRPLPFDFFLPKYNILIEFQGEQHFRYTKHRGWNNKGNFNKIKKTDKIKRDWCKKNNYYLLEIMYDEMDVIEELILATVHTIKL